MCGIAAIVGPGSAAKAACVGRMLAAMAHRGPDGEGLWASPSGSAILGHRRLSIIDPQGGHQPMSNEDGTVWVTFNGCIYNYQDLAGELRLHGHVFRTHCDTEVTLHAYEQWGPECVERFNGMWGLAIWDEKAQTLFCSRDRVGVKPFYYTWDGHTLGLASEIKALLAAGLVQARTSPAALRQYLTFQFCLDDRTLFEGVHRLEPGHNLVYHLGSEGPQVRRYWDIGFQIDEEHDEAYFVDHLRLLLEDSVRLRLRADVPLGAHLSGGLDSSSIVGLMRALLGAAPIKTFTGAFAGGEAYDETPHARHVAKSAGAEYLEIYLTPQHFRDSIEKIVHAMDEPAAGPGVFPQYWVSELASRHVKVVLGGQGGDEIFLGYARYLVAYLEECIKGAIEDTAHRGRYIATLESIVGSLPSLASYVPMLKTFWKDGLFDAPARRYFRLMDRFAESSSLLTEEARAAIDPEQTFGEFHAIFESHGAAAKINRIFCFDLRTHLQSLLHVEDRTSMAWGLESRVPLLDYRLIELMTAVPPIIKFRDGRLKSLFLQAVRNFVPPAILARRDKMGFPVPLNQWLAGDLKDFTADCLLSRSCRERGLFDPKAIERAISGQSAFGRSIWGALCLELWHRQFIDTPVGH